MKCPSCGVNINSLHLFVDVEIRYTMSLTGDVHPEAYINTDTATIGCIECPICFADLTGTVKGSVTALWERADINDVAHTLN